MTERRREGNGRPQNHCRNRPDQVFAEFDPVNPSKNIVTL
jgi:hypothetical protein